MVTSTIPEDASKKSDSVLVTKNVVASDINNFSNNSKDMEVDNQGLGEYGSQNSPRALSCDFTMSGLERCVGLKNAGCSNYTEDVNNLKDCTCSFCLKVTFIWANLHYEDIKGRVTAIKMSEKEAAALAERHYPDECSNNSSCEGNLNEYSKHNSDLQGLWKLLFLHIKDVFACESKQLQESFAVLKDLRDSCKAEVEMVNLIQSGGKSSSHHASSGR